MFCDLHTTSCIMQADSKKRQHTTEKTQVYIVARIGKQNLSRVEPEIFIALIYL